MADEITVYECPDCGSSSQWRADHEGEIECPACTGHRPPAPLPEEDLGVVRELRLGDDGSSFERGV